MKKFERLIRGCDSYAALQELLKGRVGAKYRPKLKLGCKWPEVGWRRLLIMKNRSYNNKF